MNNPLRHAGLTYYQASFDRIDPRVTVLQVVRNPSWLTPYFGCAIVGGGLLVQFLIHLAGFLTRRGGRPSAGAGPGTPAPAAA
ncbi:MAG: ResB protein required for cytochrome C biosynthesis, partial [Verrucomicrobiota bacterium]